MIYTPQKEVSLLHQVKFCTIAFWKKDKIVRTSDQFFWLFFHSQQNGGQKTQNQF